MQTEIEVKFLAVDHEQVRANLKGAGGKLVQPMRLMRRVIFDFPDRSLQKDNAYVRVRDEGDRVTLTYKHFPAADEIGGAREIEFTIGDFEKANSFLETLGLENQSFQESKRETWTIDNVEVVLDEWPWLKPYIEIEGDSEDEVRAVAAKLGFDWSDAVFGDVVAAYKIEYDLPSKKIGQSLIRFDDPRPDWMVPKKP